MPRKAPDSGIAKLFWRGNRQAVRLPKAFRLPGGPGTKVKLRRVGQSILIEPLETGPAEGETGTGGAGNR